MNMFALVLVCSALAIGQLTAADILYSDENVRYSLKPETFGIGEQNDQVDWTKHPCRRACVDGKKPLTCRYGFTVEMYSSMSRACYDCPANLTDCYRPHCIYADGKPKVLFVANRQLPGPTIEVCKGDRIQVDVTNGMMTDTTSIHWHGLHQRGTPFMDGVPYISHCPIMPGHTFRYDYEADIAGSFVWHGHSGDQRADGLMGGLIIHPIPKKNRHRDLYDIDKHVIVINEWTQNSGPYSYIFFYQNNFNEKPHTILINGLGPTDDTNGTAVPITSFEVKQGLRYRFRMLNVGAQNCPLHVSVDNHTLLAISADGADIKPVEVDTIRIMSGERYDVVLTANNEIANYWIRFRGEALCATVNQVAVLRYKGAEKVTSKEDAIFSNSSLTSYGRELNPFDTGSEVTDSLCIVNLNSTEDDDNALRREPDQKFYIEYSANPVDNTDYHRHNLYGYNQVKQERRRGTLQLNHITFKMPNFPIQTQWDQIDSDQFCNSNNVSNCDTEFRACTQRISTKLNSVVELVIIDKGSLPFVHPMHLHGYYYRVVAMEKVNDTLSIGEVRALDIAGKIKRKLKNAPKKDTLMVPKGGYAIVRLYTNNPGYWFFHCHFDKHASSGMALVLQVGEYKDFAKVPKTFPKC